MTTLAEGREHRAVAQRRSGICPRVLAALDTGPLTVASIAGRLGASIQKVRSAISYLTAHKRIAPLREGGFPYRYSRVAPADVAAEPRPRRAPRKSSGSGVIAGPKVIRGYLW